LHRLATLRRHFDPVGFGLGLVVVAAAFATEGIGRGARPGDMTDAGWLRDMARVAVGVGRFLVLPARLAPRADWRRAAVATGGAVAVTEAAGSVALALARGARPNGWWALAAIGGVAASVAGTYAFTWLARLTRANAPRGARG
jgi:hypothetical protein